MVNCINVSFLLGKHKHLLQGPNMIGMWGGALLAIEYSTYIYIYIGWAGLG